MLTQAEARKLTDEIKRSLYELIPLVIDAFNGRADVALGYESWTAYCDTELQGLSFPFARRDERMAAVITLRGAGMSGRAIGSALGVTQGTVRKDLKRATSEHDYSLPEKVTTLHGRQFPACRPVVIRPDVRKSPLYYARVLGELLEDIDNQHYGPDHLTAEQLRVLGDLREAAQQFSIIFHAEEEESIVREEQKWTS